MDECLFCRIVSGDTPCHKVWETDEHLAFLSIFPNTRGATVVIPKQHYPSYAFALPQAVLVELMLAAQAVARILDRGLEDVGRTALVFEGFGIDHVHAKLFPMHGTSMNQWRPIKSNVDKFFETYEGYVSSHDARRAADHDLADLARHLRAVAGLDNE